ncbi:MAG: hypothetical protein HOI45_01170 [Rhodospirillaceae bacterium]|nr:hypothetical protein [Rhodospirillales bacterium]MBT5035578.1 hypothetical protein [Rhodospirillaceae bacterium]MBT6218314.1 hypothetical protein [Rhodospirillaceae bacterium]
MFATVILAFQPPGPPKKLTKKPSFFLQMIAQVILVLSAVYYHAGGGGAASSADYAQWVAGFVMLPIFAMIGSAISKKAMSKQLAARQAKWEASPEGQRWAAEQARKLAPKGNKISNKLTKMPNGDYVDEDGTFYKDGKGYYIDDDGNAYMDDDLYAMKENIKEEFFHDSDYDSSKKKKKRKKKKSKANAKPDDGKKPNPNAAA